MLADDRDLTERAARIDALLADIEELPDPALRATVTEIVQDLLVLYGEGLARILAIVEDNAERAGIVEAFARDDLISHLLLLHDLHPIDVETRVLQALDEVRPYLQSHGGNVELLGVEGGVVRLRLQGSCSGCPSSTATLKLAIEEAIQKAAPDIDRIEAEGAVAPPPRPVAFVPTSALLQMREPGGRERVWTAVGSPADLSDGDITATEVGQLPIVWFKLADTFYAYRNACAGCGRRLEDGILQAGPEIHPGGARLTCAGCRRSFDVRRAGRCLDSADLFLEPIPLLVQDGVVKVAIPERSNVRAL